MAPRSKKRKALKAQKEADRLNSIINAAIANNKRVLKELEEEEIKKQNGQENNHHQH